MSTLAERINALEYLREIILKNGEALQAAIKSTYFANRWLIVENCELALKGICEQMLTKTALEAWVSNYNLKENLKAKKVGLILAGNIPLVGFHDWLAVFISGHDALIKLSEKDAILMPYLLEELVLAFPQFKKQTQFIERLKGMDAVIATGSNNSARYFEQYFGKYPNIIRKNRNGLAVLSGTESSQELSDLGSDIFSYFGLGCRSTSKIYVPRDFDFPHLMEALHNFNQIILQDKYKNNFDYQRTVLLLDNTPHFINGSIICLEGESYASKVATLHYEFYDDLKTLSLKLAQDADQIQCISAGMEIPGLETISFGQAQSPGLMDYADGVDTLSFLNKL